jgi:hypothetical protein
MQQLLVLSARKSNDYHHTVYLKRNFRAPKASAMNALLDQQLHECVGRNEALTMSSSSGDRLAFLGISFGVPRLANARLKCCSSAWNPYIPDVLSRTRR